MPRIVDIQGQKFGRMIVVGKVESQKHRALWLCKCDCGRTKIVRGGSLRSGLTQSCGCLRSEVKLLHGLSSQPIYNVWRAMRQRCKDQSYPHYADYGGRGITVCAGWDNSIENFIADMGPRPKRHSIDRVNNDDGYHCGKCEECTQNGWAANCRWETNKNQQNNKRDSRRVLLNGQMVTIANAARITNINYRTIIARLNRGWSDDEALKP